MELRILTNPVGAGLQDGDVFLSIDANTGLIKEPIVYDSSNIKHKLKTLLKPNQDITLVNFLCYGWDEFPRLVFIDYLTKQHLCIDHHEFQNMFGDMSYTAIKKWVEDTDADTVKSVIGWEHSTIDKWAAIKPILKPKKTHKWTLGKDGVQYASN